MYTNVICRVIGPPEMVLNDSEEYLPSESESIGEESARPIEKSKDNQDAVSRNSLEDEVRVFEIVNRFKEYTCVILMYRSAAVENNFIT